MKKTLLTVAMAVIAMSTIAQTTTSKSTEVKEITSIRPVDASPVVFTTQQELDDKKADKIEKIKVQIRENSENPEKVELLRKELWRFENAIVAPKRN